MTPNNTKLVERLTDVQLIALRKVAERATCRAKMEWFHMADEDYSALRRRKLITGIWSLRPEALDRERRPSRLCFATSLGKAVAEAALERARA